MQVRSEQLEKGEPFSHQPRYRLQKQASNSQATLEELCRFHGVEGSCKGEWSAVAPPTVTH